MTTLTIHPAWVRRWGHATANVLGAMIRLQVDTITEEGDDGGWFAAPYTHFDRTLHVRPETFLAARRRLTEAGVLETRSGPTNAYRLDLARLRQIETAERDQ